MKILVFGAGVLGCNLANNLSAAGKDVALLARGSWAEEIQKNGLRIKNKLPPRTTVRRLPVVSALEPEAAALIGKAYAPRKPILVYAPEPDVAPRVLDQDLGLPSCVAHVFVLPRAAMLALDAIDAGHAVAGAFASRLNLERRERLGYSYGVVGGFSR